MITFESDFYVKIKNIYHLLIQNTNMLKALY